MAPDTALYLGIKYPHTFPAVRQPRSAARSPRVFPIFPLHPPNCYRIHIRRTYAVPSIGLLHPSMHNGSWTMLKRAKRMKKIESKVRADRSRCFSRSVGTSLGWIVIDMASKTSLRTGLLIPFEGPAKVYTLEENIDNTSIG